MPGLKALVLVFACVLVIVENTKAQPTPCNSEPCRNNGWCTADGGSYECFCRPGFTGVNCETHVLRNLTITVKSTLYDLFIDGVRQNCTNRDNWTLADEIVLAPTNRLVSVMAVDSQENCAGVIASVTGDFLVTDSQWRCNPNGDINWQDLGFNDTLWPLAWELGSNFNITQPTGCNNILHGVSSISPNAKWIWVDSMASPPLYHQTIYCRQYIPICEYESPCLNAGTCNRNNNTICSCLVGFTGEYCENADVKQLNLTAKDHLYAVYVDGVPMTLQNSDNWRKADSLTIFSTSRLVAVMAIQLEGSCPGILVSVDDASGDYVVSNVSWKCSSVAPVGWAELGFDDSTWAAAAVVRKNELNNDTQCEQLDVISGISEEAYWIWTDAVYQHVTVYCRGMLPICDVHPCNNGGTCNANARDLCTCPPGFRGTHCQEEIVTEVTGAFTESMDHYKEKKLA